MFINVFLVARGGRGLDPARALWLSKYHRQVGKKVKGNGILFPTSLKLLCGSKDPVRIYGSWWEHYKETVSFAATPLCTEGDSAADIAGKMGEDGWDGWGSLRLRGSHRVHGVSNDKLKKKATTVGCWEEGSQTDMLLLYRLLLPPII